jgi:hypothetical protein
VGDAEMCGFNILGHIPSSALPSDECTHYRKSCADSFPRIANRMFHHMFRNIRNIDGYLHPWHSWDGRANSHTYDIFFSFFSPFWLYEELNSVNPRDHSHEFNKIGKFSGDKLSKNPLAVTRCKAKAIPEPA